MNNTEAVGAIKTTSVAGDANLMITGKLMEIIEEDLISETKKERQEISDDEINFQTQQTVNNHAQQKVTTNSGEKGANH